MDLFDEKIDELLAKHLAGECSAAEEAEIERWLAGSAEHRKYLEELQWLWQHSPEGLTPAPRAVDTEQALERVKIRLQERPKLHITFGRGRLWFRAAAVFALIAAAVYWWQTGNTPEPVRIATTDSILTDTLSDGSVITLERRSGLTLATGFNRRERRLRLEGEAYFAVAHDTTRPFYVEVRELEIRVVGTAFQVDNASDPGKVIIRVSEGKVLVRSKNQSLLLVRGEEAIYDRAEGALSQKPVLPKQGNPAGANRQFRFEATPLSTVIQRVNEAYGVQISVKSKNLERCLLTARYNNLPLERVLELIADSFSFTLQKDGNTYVFDGPGCGE